MQRHRTLILRNSCQIIVKPNSIIRTLNRKYSVKLTFFLNNYTLNWFDEKICFLVNYSFFNTVTLWPHWIFITKFSIFAWKYLVIFFLNLQIWRKKWFGYRDNFHPTKDVSNVSWQRFTMHFYSRFIDKVTSWQARVAWIVLRNKTRRIFLKMYTSRSDIIVVLLECSTFFCYQEE